MIFGVSQSTVSRRWDRFRPVIKRAVASFIRTPGRCWDAEPPW